MTQKIWKFAAIGAATITGLTAQQPPVPPGGAPFQQASQIGQPLSGPLGQPTRDFILLPAGRGGAQPVVGKPFSATEERKTVQTLADGTQIENADTSLLYRDNQGRVRTETTNNGRTRVMIADPVAHTTVVL